METHQPKEKENLVEHTGKLTGENLKWRATQYASNQWCVEWIAAQPDGSQTLLFASEVECKRIAERHNAGIERVKQEAAAPWIKTSERAPSKQDAVGANGQVLFRSENTDQCEAMLFDTNEINSGYWTHWMPIPALLEQGSGSPRDAKE